MFKITPLGNLVLNLVIAFSEVRIMQKSFALAGVLAGVFLLFLSH
jgi:hypothetical protein